MKTYRHPETGQVQQVDDNATVQAKILEQAGYVLWDDATQAQAREQAQKEAAGKLAAAQKEMAERYPERLPYYVAEETVVAEGTVEPVDKDKPPKPGTVVAEGTIEPQPPKPPAVPKKN